MMNVIVVSPKASCKSAKALAEAIGAVHCNPYEQDRYDFSKYDGVINYGVSRKLRYQNIVNTPEAVSICVDKLKTFEIFKKNGIAHPGFTTKKAEVPKDWETVVVRTDLYARANKGMDYWYAHEGKPLPDAVLYTKYFEHENEYRIVVLFGEVMGRYIKKTIVDAESPDGRWDFLLMHKQGFEAVDAECIKAAKALGIDYVGFDVVENKKGQFQILEANSGPILTEEVSAKFIKAFKGVEK